MGHTRGQHNRAARRLKELAARNSSQMAQQPIATSSPRSFSPELFIYLRETSHKLGYAILFEILLAYMAHCGNAFACQIWDAMDAEIGRAALICAVIWCLTLPGYIWAALLARTLPYLILLVPLTKIQLLKSVIRRFARVFLSVHLITFVLSVAGVVALDYGVQHAPAAMQAARDALTKHAPGLPQKRLHKQHVRAASKRRRPFLRYISEAPEQYEDRFNLDAFDDPQADLNEVVGNIDSSNSGDALADSVGAVSPTVSVPSSIRSTAYPPRAADEEQEDEPQ